VTDLSQSLLSLAQNASTPQLSGTLRELAQRAEGLERRAAEAQEMKDAVPAALRERAPVLEGRGWIDAMRRRLEQLEALARGRRLGPQDNVADFHHRFGHAAPGRPHDMPPELARFRARLIMEEAGELARELELHAQETFEAYQGGRGSLARVAGEACDLMYVTLGTLVAAGLPIAPFWDEVHRANMEKVPNPEGGKPTKPEGWKPPDLLKVLKSLQ